MKSAQTMLVGLAALLLAACNQTPKPFTSPGVHTAPYDLRNGEVTWAVVPLRNESGTSVVDPLVVSDVLVASIQEIRGVRSLSVNRTIEAMRSLGLGEAPLTEAQARDLARTLGVSGIVAGSITAYDPYDPPTIGLSLALFTETVSSAAVIDPTQLTRATTDQVPGSGSGRVIGDRNAVVASEHLDGRSHDVLMRLQRYAEGRNDKRSANGWRIYLASMDLYTKFATFELVGQLLEEEWLRLARESTRQAHGG